MAQIIYRCLQKITYNIYIVLNRMAQDIYRALQGMDHDIYEGLQGAADTTTYILYSQSPTFIAIMAQTHYKKKDPI